MDQLREVVPPSDAPRYFPPASGVYDVKPGLSPLATDWGNGQVDKQVFQFDSARAHYREVKEQARAERLGKYYQTSGFDPEVAAPVCRFVAEQLALEHPDRFRLAVDPDGWALSCLGSDEVLRVDQATGLVSGGRAVPGYADAFDALAMQVQEDMAVVRRAAGRDWCCTIHLCYPYRWTAEDKIGLDFVTMHLPVPGMENFRRPGMVNVMVQRGPLVRFVWELTTDTRLNHHPEPPPGLAPEQWDRKPFDLDRPCLFLRVEREVVWSFPEQDAALLTVRTSFWDLEQIRRDPTRRDALCAAVESMSSESRQYKGLGESGDQVLAWLRSD